MRASLCPSPHIMAPAKGSRKGKKAWRKNINTRQVISVHLVGLHRDLYFPTSQLYQLAFLLSARRGRCPAAEGRAARDLVADVP